ncbi:MAG TPA: response regulator [Steroidobacteraceae bacterium]|jgi:signal transduction histidine kinase/CheY-like chemotaxis protein/CHASE3 domain sensor protein|nr:response regulator [Steroidobacteraceae bacterium]
MAQSSARSGPPLPASVLAGFAAAIVAVVLMAAVSYQGQQRGIAAADAVTQGVERIVQVQNVLSSTKDAETGQRGFLLTGDEAYLEPYVSGSAAIASELAKIRGLTASNLEQRQRLDQLQVVIAAKLAEQRSTIALKRAGKSAEALAEVRTDRGKVLMDRIRALVDEMQNVDRAQLAQRQLEWQQTAALSTRITWIGAGVLLVLIAAAAALVSRDYRARQLQTWLRLGQMGLGERIQGDQTLEVLGNNVVSFLAQYLGAQVGAIYIADGADRFRRFAGYALPPNSPNESIRGGDTLLGQAVRDNRAVRLVDIPPDYVLPIASAIGRGAPREILIAPASIDGTAQGAVEFGFFGRTDGSQQQLLELLSTMVAVAVRSSKDRTRLEELLEETQRQAEELQSQQEELRVNNEELDEQSRALKESQAQMESQQVELEQTNAQLEEQTQMLEHQKETLSKQQELLVERAADLERANLYKSQFLANMSHELRTPLNSTLILAKILGDNKDGNLTEQQVKFAHTISTAGNDLLALINDVLDLSKIEAGKIDLKPEAVRIAKAIDDQSKLFQPQAEKRGIKFSAAVLPGTADTIVTDPQRLGQILKNLCSNAVKFTERGEVTLKVSSDANAIYFNVSDTGVGIPESQHRNIFEAFQQADGSIHRKFGGTGLGLSISRDLAHRLGGQITLQSIPGQGSVFTLRLPHVLPVESEDPTAAAAQPEVKRNAVIESAAPKPRRPAPAQIEDDRAHLQPHARCILVIEDDAAFAGILRDLAREMNYQCVVTHSASDGLLAATELRPSAILLDVNLPDYSGLGVLGQLKRNPITRHIPVHITSVADHSQGALELGAVGYALKPVSREQLVDALRRLETKLSQGVRRVLVVEDDERQRDSIRELLTMADLHITAVESGGKALVALRSMTFDCMVMDLTLPDFSGFELLERMAEQEDVSVPPVIVYTGRALSADDEQKLRRFSKSIILKDARSPERLLDEVTLFLHQVESALPADRQRMLKMARDQDVAFEGRRILVVEDDVRNIFALTSLLEPKGAQVQIARNGHEALGALAKSTARDADRIDLVLMDVMMPEMDGFTAMREIRKRAEWKRLPIIALTAKAMQDDLEACMAAGANDYIAKPLDVEKLLSLIRVWMPK